MTRVAVVGAGAIGSSWAALFAARGHDVVVTDPSPGAADALAPEVARCWASLTRQGLVRDGADPARVTMVPTIAEAVEGASFVQENAPERVQLKLELYREMDDVAPSDAIIASSSSGIRPSELQRGCERFPERVLVGHPFNPPHLVPLVEVVGGAQTSERVIDATMDFYRSCAKTPIRVRAELPGHVTNRLQAALWREAYWLVEQGIASVEDIDTAISSGPGLRWALLGPFATQHFSGGPGGIAHILEHLGPPMVEWWESFETPAWGPELVDQVIAGVDAELDGADQAALLARRDHLLEQLLVAKHDRTDTSGEPAP